MHTVLSDHPDIADPPCETCVYRLRCAMQRLACQGFRAYLSHGRSSRFVYVPDEPPSRAMWAAIYLEPLRRANAAPASTADRPPREKDPAGDTRAAKNAMTTGSRPTGAEP
jgi:hypothetical protein